MLTVALGPDGHTVVAAGASDDVLVYDLAYFERHMAGNLEQQLERLSEEWADETHAASLRAWARGVLARPWPRWGAQR